MGLRWTLDEYGTHTAWHPQGAWDHTDLDVGEITPVDRQTGWQARYWGHVESLRWHTGTGPDPAVIGGTWDSVEEAKAEIEKAHAGDGACE